MSVSGIRLPGLSTGMDTEQMVKSMLTAEQNKIDKAKQEKEKLGWQQEVYRDVIDEVKALNDKYFDVLSPDYVGSTKSYNTTTISSSNSNVVSAIAGATNTEIDYTFDVKGVATSPMMSTKEALNGKKIALDMTLEELGLKGESSFKIKIEKNGKIEDSKEIKVDEKTTVKELMKKIEEATDGKVQMTFAEMDGSLRIKASETGADSKFSIENSDGSGTDALGFLGLNGKQVSGTNTKVEIRDSQGTLLRTEESSKNSFTIDNVTYSINGVGSASLKGSVDTTSVVDRMKDYVKEYNAIIDKVYNIVTEKVNKDYSPLTEAQKEEMTEKQIEAWEKKAKEGILRNDNELRRFLNDLESAMGNSLSKYGITSSTDYTKRGQIALDEKKFVDALRNDSASLTEAMTATMDKTKKVLDNYVGSSSSVFIQKAGREKTSTVVNNLFSEQIRLQEEKISKLLQKFTDKETQLYSKFALLESNMSKLNTQMTYLMQ